MYIFCPEYMISLALRVVLHVKKYFPFIILVRRIFLYDKRKNFDINTHTLSDNRYELTNERHARTRALYIIFTPQILNFLPPL